ncbi:putative U3 small nucleolar RNA-associated protein 11 [Thelohanellus kitauei]|uniref:Probable U3 small nucleolar RNA-associated protein 11 n=1 Tax=Thelohanellus kitauei TaxID=669202 RepID=A0A0C2M249_THEKT|nr:putative U3 small nucleolar RNA-associated protein 11 [Thelohanellus kitauei]
MYKERSQPSRRKNLGMLEKHKDYVKRAAACNKRKKELKRLKILARDKNPDEFNYRMITESRMRNSGNQQEVDYASEMHQNICDEQIMRIQRKKLKKELNEAAEELMIRFSLKPKDKAQEKFERMKNRIKMIKEQLEKIRKKVDQIELKNNLMKSQLRNEVYYETQDEETGKKKYRWRRERKR